MGGYERLYFSFFAFLAWRFSFMLFWGTFLAALPPLSLLAIAILPMVVDVPKIMRQRVAFAKCRRLSEV